MAKTRQIGKLKFNLSKRGLAYKWGDGEVKCIPFGTSGDDQEDTADERYQQYGEQEEQYDEEYENDQEYDQGEEPFYEKTPFIWLMLLLVAPIGIWLLWRKKLYEKNARTGLSIAALIWFIILLILLFGGKNKDKVNPGTVTTMAPRQSAAVATMLPTRAPTTAPTLAPTEKPLPTPRAETTADVTGTTGDDAASSTTVYFTPNGQYYHAASKCGAMTEGTASTLAWAQQLGKTACPDCMGGTAAGTTTTSSGFYATDNGTYFHLKSTCSGMKNAKPISQAAAVSAGKIPCPTCVGYFATKGGTYYHVKSDCSQMKNAELVTEAVCKSRGQTPCPVCIGGSSDTQMYFHTAGGKYYHIKKDCSGMKNATQVSLAVAVKSGQIPCPDCIGKNAPAVTYYATTTGKYYHTNKTCSGMKNAKQVTEAAAKASGKNPCPTCVTAAGTATGTTTVYYTKGGKYYHTKDSCSGMKKATAGTVAAAKKAGKTACPTCVTPVEVKVYCTAGGKYYHTKSNCSGMKNATYITLTNAKKNGKTACPECVNSTTLPDVNTDATEVWCTKNGKWYHVTPTCSGMKGAAGTTVAKAAASGRTACPTCIGKNPNATVYATKAGIYYHSKSTCSGMTGAGSTTITNALVNGKLACPVCVGTSGTKVYMTQNGTYYHVKKTCSGMSGATFVTLSAAQNAGKAACPRCIGTDSAISKVTPAPTKTTTGTKTVAAANSKDFSVYCTKDGTYYHTKSSCSGMSGAKACTLSSVTKAGKLPCPTCVQLSSDTVVYGNPDGKYYHTNKTCSGMTGASTLTVSVAKANGKTACPTCAGGKNTTTKTSSTTSTADRVYCTAGGNYYHKTPDCSGMKNAMTTTKTRAISVYNKVACPVCYKVTSGTTTAANTKPETATGSTANSTYAALTSVYCTKNGTYYHLKSNCSGMKGAAATTADQARAAGKTACPACINTSSSTRVFTSVSNPYYHNKSVCGGVTYDIATSYTNAVKAGKTGCPSCTGKNTTAAGTATGTSSVKAWANKNSVYYHSKASCGVENLTNATYVSIAKCKEIGKTACPLCMPAV